MDDTGAARQARSSPNAPTRDRVQWSAAWAGQKLVAPIRVHFSVWNPFLPDRYVSMPRCYIALGGNLGQVAVAFDLALARLSSQGCPLRAVSRFHRTAPVGVHSDGTFLNAAAEIQTELPPLELLDRLHAIEAELGRTRGLVWEPRTLDLDVLFYGDQIVESPRLVIPHPGCWYRRFVLDPLVEIAPDLVHPIKQVTIRTLRERLLVRPLVVALAGGTDEIAGALKEQLSTRFDGVTFVRWLSNSPNHATVVSDPTFVVWLGGGPGDSTGWTDLPRLPRIDVCGLAISYFEIVSQLVQSALGE